MNSKKIEDQLLALQQQSTSSELNKNQSQKELSSKNESEIKDQLSDDEEDDKNFEKKQQQHSNLSNILQLMQKERNNLQQQHDLSSEEEQFEEEDEELLSDEDKFAAMLSNNAQLQQLLLSNTTSSNAQPSTSKVLNLYEELIGQQSFNQQDDPQELSDYERFTKLAAQQQLLQLEQEDKLKQLQNSSLRKLNNSIYTKLYQCNICEYNTRWLSNLYAHEKRRHNTCTSSQGNLKVITIRRDATSPNSRQSLNNNQMNLNNLLIGLENHQQQQQQQQKSTSSSSNNQTPTNRMNDDILNQLNDFNNNSNLSNNFANLLQTNDSSSTKTAIKPIKERTASGDGQFVCTICSKSYRHKHSLQRHLISHRNQENNTNNTSSNQQSNKLNQDQTTTHSAFKTELELPNESNNNTLNMLTQSTNGTSTPSSFLNNRSSSVDSVKSGDHNLKHQQQMFSQEILESLISGSNSSILNNLMSANVHSPPTNSTPYSNSPTTADTTAMFTV